MIDFPRFNPSFRVRLWQSAFFALAGFIGFRLFIDLMFFDFSVRFPFLHAPSGLGKERASNFAEMLAFPAAYSYAFALIMFLMSLALGWIDVRRQRNSKAGWRARRQRRNVLGFKREP